MKMTDKNHLLKCSYLLYLVLFLQTCYATNTTTNPRLCTPSSCGRIRNISFPFRLKHDPKHCGNPDYELACENNVSFLYLNSQKYEAKAINYRNFTIRLADVSVNNNTCSFPTYSAYSDNFTESYPYYTERNRYSSSSRDYIPVELPRPINLMSCPYPLKNSSLFTELPTNCGNGYTFSGRHTYVKVGHMSASEVKDKCRVEVIVMTSWMFKDLKNVSVSEIHNSLLYGFELTWFNFRCRKCKEGLICPRNDGDIVNCAKQDLRAKLEALWSNINNSSDVSDGLSAAVILMILLVLGSLFDYVLLHQSFRTATYGRMCFENNNSTTLEARISPDRAEMSLVLLAGVSIPAKIIIGFFCAWGFVNVEMHSLYFNTSWHISHLPLIIVLFFVVRCIIAAPCITLFWINKFRRRHLSMYDVIEDFLQSENQLMPMRYSYSDIKKITGGFREKLGQGGYGTVYKGKLRSGYDVAVKLLGKPGGNGQDFMNEISTIGRIHHVNVVKLVGYCAERSKRALVFDFMPNGSLDKYLYSREETNCLSWGRKYEIAIGVARGIEYLHRGCDIQILHFDIKPHNILLDDNFIPKITDFGLAKFFSPEKRVVTMTAIRGTIGYVAPELINRGFGEVSYKADVYSFGMLLMEIVGLNKHLKGSNQASSQYFPDWIYDCFEQGHDIEIEELIDKNDNGTNKEIAKKMTIVALWCIQMSPGDRPSMNKVVEMLEAKVERLRVPNKPSESTRVAVTYEDQSLTTYSTDSVSMVPHDATPSVEITVED